MHSAAKYSKLSILLQRVLRQITLQTILDKNYSDLYKFTKLVKAAKK